MRGGKATLSKAAAELSVPESRVSRAFDILVMYGVAAPEGEKPVRAPVPPDPQELLSLKQSDESFRGVCNYYETAAGRVMSRYELEGLSALRFELSLPADLICLMINFVREEKRLSIRNLEKLAYEWHDAGVLTYEDGEKRISEIREKTSRVYVIMRLFGLYDRKPSDSERSYIEKWIGMGFTDEMLKLAYEKATMRTHSVSFAYINGILENWKKSGISSPSAVAVKDALPAEKTSAEERVAAAFEEKRHKRELTAQKRLSELSKSSPVFAENEKNIRLLASKAARASGDARKNFLSERDRLIGERAAILRSLSLPDDWLEPRPDCPVCNDYGYVGARMCDCFKKALAAVNKR